MTLAEILFGRQSPKHGNGDSHTFRPRRKRSKHSRPDISPPVGYMVFFRDQIKKCASKGRMGWGMCKQCRQRSMTSPALNTIILQVAIFNSHYLHRCTHSRFSGNVASNGHKNYHLSPIMQELPGRIHGARSDYVAIWSILMQF